MKDYVQANKAAYDLIAPEYLDRTGKSTEPIEALAGIPLAYVRGQFSYNISTLEIGPGSGEICAYYAEQGCATTAIDVAPKILDNVRVNSPSTECIEADILTFALNTNTYEMIYCGALIHLFSKSDAETVLSNISQALKPMGILFINTTIHQNSSEGYYEKHDYENKVKRFRHRYTLSEFESLIKQSGLIVIDQLTTDESDRDKYWLAYICKKP